MYGANLLKFNFFSYKPIRRISSIVHIICYARIRIKLRQRTKNIRARVDLLFFQYSVNGSWRESEDGLTDRPLPMIHAVRCTNGSLAADSCNFNCTHAVVTETKTPHLPAVLRCAVRIDKQCKPCCRMTLTDRPLHPSFSHPPDWNCNFTGGANGGKGITLSQYSVSIIHDHPLPSAISFRKFLPFSTLSNFH